MLVNIDKGYAQSRCYKVTVLSTTRLQYRYDKNYINTNEYAAINIKNKDNFLSLNFLEYASQLTKKEKWLTPRALKIRPFLQYIQSLLAPVPTFSYN